MIALDSLSYRRKKLIIGWINLRNDQNLIILNLSTCYDMINKLCVLNSEMRF